MSAAHFVIISGKSIQAGLKIRMIKGPFLPIVEIWRHRCDRQWFKIFTIHVGFPYWFSSQCVEVIVYSFVEYYFMQLVQILVAKLIRDSINKASHNTTILSVSLST